MALIIHEPEIARLDDAELTRLKAIPPAVLSDELNRAGTMDSGIKPIAPGMTFAGQAITIDVMVGSNVAMHYALDRAWEGAILVVDAQGHTGTAVLGGIIAYAMKKKGIGAIVIDGAVRDVAEMRDYGLVVFTRGATPRGPHRGWGGTINGPIQCGGAAVSPGDVLVGDDDGIIVIRPDQLDGLADRCEARMAKEEETIAKIDAGVSTLELNKLPPPEEIS